MGYSKVLILKINLKLEHGLWSSAPMSESNMCAKLINFMINIKLSMDNNNNILTPECCLVFLWG